MTSSVPSIEAVAERLARLEADCARLARQNRFWKRAWMMLVVCGICSLLLGPIIGSKGFLRTAHAQAAAGVARYAAEDYLLRNAQGKLMGVFAMHYDEGSSSLSLHGKDERVRLWLRVAADGEPGIIFFDKNGQDPYELVVQHQGQPQLRFRRPPFPAPADAPNAAPAANPPPGQAPAGAPAVR